MLVLGWIGYRAVGPETALGHCGELCPVRSRNLYRIGDYPEILGNIIAVVVCVCLKGMNPVILEGCAELVCGIVSPAVNVAVSGEGADVVLSGGKVDDISEVA